MFRLRVQLVRIPILERPLLIPALPACHFLSPTALIPILLFLRPQNLLHPDRSYHHPKHEQPRNDQADRQRAPDILNRAIIVERARNGERGRRERRVREDERVPRHGEVHLPARGAAPVRADADEEEPERQAPQPEPQPARHDHADARRKGAVAGAHEVGRDHPRQVLAHCYDAGDGEARGTHADEHAWAQGFFGEFLCHEAVDEGGVDHE